jgi:hypothetical protein
MIHFSSQLFNTFISLHQKTRQILPFVVKVQQQVLSRALPPPSPPLIKEAAMKGGKHGGKKRSTKLSDNLEILKNIVGFIR